MKDITAAIVTVLTAIVGVAIVAVLVSRNAQTSQVITSTAQGFAGDLSAAIAPVTGSQGFNWGMSGGLPVEGSYY